VGELRGLVEPAHSELTIGRQCELLGLSRSSYYYEGVGESDEDLVYKRFIDEQYLKTPFYGNRRMTVELQKAGHEVNRKRVRRLMHEMGLEAIYPGPKTSVAEPGHKIYPYLLRNVVVSRPNHVWSTDITYVPMRSGFLFLVAVIDWYSRYVLSWGLSNSLEKSFCVEALEAALERGQPEIFNTDQGSQFTSPDFTGRLNRAGILVSMDGRGRALDNVFVERLWRSVKYEEIFLKDYADAKDAYSNLFRYFCFYNTERPHQSLEYRTPTQVHHGAGQ
jgi:putative transposase